MSYLKGRNLGSNKTFDLVTIGQASLDIINNDLGISTELLGWAAVYVAAIASSLKLRTGLVTNIGYDFNPDFLNLLKGTGVDFTGVHQKPGPSSRINLYYHGDYKKNITVFEGVGSSLSVMDL